MVQLGRWAVGVAALGQGTDRASVAGADTIEVSGVVIKLTLAYLVAEGLSIGRGLRALSLRVDRENEAGGTSELFATRGDSYEIGALWAPSQYNICAGANWSLPVRSEETTVDNCDPLNCAGYVIPEQVKLPWLHNVGSCRGRLRVDPGLA